MYPGAMVLPPWPGVFFYASSGQGTGHSDFKVDALTSKLRYWNGSTVTLPGKSFGQLECRTPILI
jgi:hypothetical protein